jgi:GSCFA family protein
MTLAQSPPQFVPYPRSVEEFSDLDNVIRQSVLNNYPADDLLADPQAIVMTQGSCFASNVASSLARLGARVAHLNVNEVINTTIANAMFFEHAFGGKDCNPAVREVFNQIVHAQALEEFRALVAACRAFILTIGVAPCWFVRGTDQLVLEPDRRRMEDFEMRTTSPSWNAENIRSIIASIRAVNPATRIFLTLSPAPLNWSHEFSSTIVGDCLSKSVLRVAIHEVLSSQPEGVRYWPSFEVVRWVGCHVGPVFGAEDGQPRHVSNFVVDAIVRSFISMHGGNPAAVAAGRKPVDNTGPFTLARNF